MGFKQSDHPDLYGLPEYRITDIVTEIDGKDVRVACGSRRFGEVHWLYSVLFDAETYLMFEHRIKAAAEQAFNAGQMTGIHPGH